MYVIIFVYKQIIIMTRGEVLNVKAKYKSIVNNGSAGDIISAVVIGIECIVATSVILVNLLN